VFDFLAFKYDRGDAVLLGYAYAPALKQDAERGVKRVPGVDVVQNKIEQLPPSRMDDEIRWREYYAIHSDPLLSKYALGAAMLWVIATTSPASRESGGGVRTGRQLPHSHRRAKTAASRSKRAESPGRSR
jgi:hypothetical protein